MYIGKDTSVVVKSCGYHMHGNLQKSTHSGQGGGDKKYAGDNKWRIVTYKITKKRRGKS